MGSSLVLVAHSLRFVLQVVLLDVRGRSVVVLDFHDFEGFFGLVLVLLQDGVVQNALFRGVREGWTLLLLVGSGFPALERFFDAHVLACSQLGRSVV